MIATGVDPNCILKEHNQGYSEKKEILKLDTGVRFYVQFTEQPQHFRKHEYALFYLVPEHILENKWTGIALWAKTHLCF